MNKADRDHMSLVALLGCMACRRLGYETPQVELHHINNGTMGKRASNKEVIGLCHTHHRTGGYSVAVHAGRKAFESAIGATERELLEDALNAL